MIYLTQWLCASRHCSIALLWDDQVDSQETMVEKGEAIYRSRLVNRWCGICGGNVEPEHTPTRFATLDEAQLELAPLEAENAVARDILGTG